MADWPASGIEYVSFDIFDTLLHRRVKAPVDVFEAVRLKLLESRQAVLDHDLFDSFTTLRMQAETRAREDRRAQAGDDGEITLDEIYSAMRGLSGCDEALTDMMKSVELDLEDVFLFASPEGGQRYEQARAAGLPIAFISDMYLPSAWLGQKLERAGLKGAADIPLYVSGEHRIGKHDGALFRKVSTDLGWPLGKSWLHVGDNRHADVRAAEKAGLETEHATWADVDNRLVPTPGPLDSHTIGSLTGFLKQKQAGNLLPEDELGRIGYTVWGPMLFGFTLWLASQIRQNDLKRLLFVARDGWLLQKIYERCKPLLGHDNVETEYFFMSRKTGYQTGVRDWDVALNWYFVAGKVPKSARRMLTAAGLNPEPYRKMLAEHGIPDMDAPVPVNEQIKVKNVIDKLFMPILTENARQRKKFARYYTDAFAGHERIGFIDIGWSGNIQRSFVNSLPDVSARENVLGFFVGALPSAGENLKRGIRIEGWLEDGVGAANWEHLLVNGGAELMEFILSADGGSTIGLKENPDGSITPLREESTPAEEEYRAKARKAQAGVLKFVDDNLYLLEHFSPETLCSSAWAAEFARLVENPNESELAQLAGITHSDAPGANDERLPLAIKLSGIDRYLPHKRRKARKASFWKFAFRKLN